MTGRSAKGHVWAALAVAASLAISACGSSGPSASAKHTAAIEAAAVARAKLAREPRYAQPGPYPVGVRTYTLPDGNKVEVWYPSTGVAVADQPQATYRLSDWIPPALQAKVPPTVDTYTTDAYRDVALSPGGPFPLALFSHGYASYRDQSTFLTTHLASWGMVVASPDHPSRGLLSVLTGAKPQPGAALGDMRETVALLRGPVTAAGAPLAGAIDFDHAAILGHSAGSGTAIQAAGDPQLGVKIDEYIAMSAGGEGAIALPKVPSVWMAGALDNVAKPAETKQLYASAPAPKRFYLIGGSGHLAFTEVCEIGQGKGGVLGIAATFGIQVPAQLHTLATDGCQATAIPPPDVWPAIDNFAVGNLRAVWGIDTTPVGVNAVNAFGKVKITTVHSP